MLREKNIVDFTNLLASKEAVPGGGGASALAGALGAALASMVGNLTLGKKRYKDVEEDIIGLQEETKKYIDEFLALIDGDAIAFLPLSKAYSLPSKTQEEKEYKDKIMEEALNTASSAPLLIMERAHEMLVILKEYAEKGSKLAISDVAVSSVMLRSAILGASVNIFINAKMMKNREVAEELNSRCDQLIEEGKAMADEIFKSVEEKIR